MAKSISLIFLTLISVMGVKGVNAEILSNIPPEAGKLVIFTSDIEATSNIWQLLTPGYDFAGEECFVVVEETHKAIFSSEELGTYVLTCISVGMQGTSVESLIYTLGEPGPEPQPTKNTTKWIKTALEKHLKGFNIIESREKLADIYFSVNKVATEPDGLIELTTQNVTNYLESRTPEAHTAWQLFFSELAEYLEALNMTTLEQHNKVWEEIALGFKP